MERKISLKKASALGAKDTAAVAAVTIGIQMAQQAPYWPGVALVIVGAALFIVDKVIE